jgi:23S rRNA-/tRNA-specific pseudouridylate synthase
LIYLYNLKYYFSGSGVFMGNYEKAVDITYQDENVLVINNPSGVLVIPDQHTYENETLIGILKDQTKHKNMSGS